MSSKYYPLLEGFESLKDWLNSKAGDKVPYGDSTKDTFLYLNKDLQLISELRFMFEYANSLKKIESQAQFYLVINLLGGSALSSDQDAGQVFYAQINGDPMRVDNFLLTKIDRKKFDKKLIDNLIKPKIKKWISINVSNPQLKTVYKTWLDNPEVNESILYSIRTLSESIGPLSNEITQNAEYTDINAGLLVNSSININTKQLAKDFIESTNNLSTADIPALFGFDDYLEQNASGGFLGIGASSLASELLTAKKLEELINNDPTVFAEAVTVAQGLDYKKPTAEELVNLRQCALITGLLHQKHGFPEYFTTGKFIHSPLNTISNPAGHNRIYPVHTSYDPNMFYNLCHISNDAREILEVETLDDANGPSNLHKTLWWVFESNGALKEIELPLTSNKKEQDKAEDIFLYRKAREILLFSPVNVTQQQKESRVTSLLGESLTLDQIDQKLSELTTVNEEEKKSDQAYYILNDIEIKYEGTNPSTARNDVQVQMSFTLSSLKALECVMVTIPSDYTDNREEANIKLYELITLPITNKVSKGPGSYLRNQFNPEYSRVRLKVFNGIDHKSDLIIDLSTIDHSIQRESETGTTTLTINYRGFFEALMNMPFNDAIASEDTLKKREQSHGEAMKIINTNDCKPELINKAMRIEQEIYRREAKTASPNTLLSKLITRNCIHGYSIDEGQLQGRAINGTLDSSIDYVTNVIPSSGFNEVEAQTIEESLKETDVNKRLEKAVKNKFFFLGDLLYVASDCLYDPNNPDQMRDIVKNLNMRFMVGSINVPNPKTRDGSMITINPVCIPIDVTYFIEWFNATIVSKGITTYPVGIFIKELVERLVNNIIFEVCFSSLLPSENPPMIRLSFISNFDNQGWFLKKTDNIYNDGWFLPDDPYYKLSPGVTSLDLFAKNLFVKNALFNYADTKQKVFDVNPYNYCVIYQQYPSFSQYTTRDQTQKLRNKPFVPTIFYGSKNTNFNYVSGVSFSKTDSPFLREARYFNSNYGNLSLLSNVYDLNFNFMRRKANTFLYPGIIINFVLLDWYDTGSESPYVTLSNKSGLVGNPPESDDYTVFGESNPHSPNTLAHIMGFGGYFIIKSVTYKLGQTPGVWEINITTKFMGTDAIKKLDRGSNEDRPLEDSEKCVEAYNSLIERVDELEEALGKDEKAETYDIAVVVEKEEQQQANQNPTRQMERSDFDEYYLGQSDTIEESYNDDSYDPDLYKDYDYAESYRSPNEISTPTSTFAQDVLDAFTNLKQIDKFSADDQGPASDIKLTDDLKEKLKKSGGSYVFLNKANKKQYIITLLNEDIYINGAKQ